MHGHNNKGQSRPPQSHPLEPTCPVCKGEGRNPRAVSISEWDSAITFDACETCGGAGVLYHKDLYQCQGQGCGVIVFGSVLEQISKDRAPCNCGGPVSQFHYLTADDWPSSADWAEAVWTIHDIRTRT